MRAQTLGAIIVFIAAIIAASEAASCTPVQNQATTLPNIIPNPTATITLDDLSYSAPRDYEASPHTITVGSQSITFSGISCTASDYILSMDSTGSGTVWNGAAGWQGGQENGKPGYYFGGVSDGSQLIYESTCLITFSPPISEIWFRYNRASEVVAVANIYDSVDKFITCVEMGNKQNFGGSNYYLEAGWRATSRQIKKLEINGGFFAADNIQWRTGCGDGNYWNGSGCADFDECLLGQCSPKATCANVNNAVQCTCKSGYTGDGIGPNGCTDVNECAEIPNGNCPTPSVCGNTDGSFYCYCPDGYTGNSGSPQEVTCEDINECSLVVNYPCVESATCINKQPGFTCQCPNGYTGDGTFSGNGCTLIDLCDSTPCSPDASCTSVGGLTYTCQCNPGFSGNGEGPNGCTAIPGSQPQGSNTPSDTPSQSTPSGTPTVGNSPDVNTPSTGNTPASGPGAAPKSNLVSPSDSVRIGFGVVCFAALLSL